MVNDFFFLDQNEQDGVTRETALETLGFLQEDWHQLATELSGFNSIGLFSIGLFEEIGLKESDTIRFFSKQKQFLNFKLDHAIFK